MFAKTFNSESYGQVLITKKENDDGDPALVCTVEPDGFGLCELSMAYRPTDKGYETRDSTFETVDLKLAEMMASEIFKLIK